MAERKKALAAEYGLEGVFPADTAPDLPEGLPPEAYAHELAAICRRTMDSCDGCLANLTPFHGPSADVGTVGEVFYMFANNKPVFGYSNDPRDYGIRVAEDFYRTDIEPRKPGTYRRGPDGMMIENFGLFDNLMIPYALRESGGGFFAASAPPESYYTDLEAFRQAVRAAADYFGTV